MYLPPSYDNSPSVRYPVVYLLHGFGTTDVSWVRGFAGGMGVAGIMDSLVATYAAREMIVVMPNGSTRFGGGFYVNSATSGNWDDFVARDLVAWTDAKYRTLARPESRGIAGHSMGGYGALYLGMRHGGETFGALYAMSACCITPFGFDPARDGATWDTVGQASTPAAIPRAGLGSRAIVALSEAFAPDST